MEDLRTALDENSPIGGSPLFEQLLRAFRSRHWRYNLRGWRTKSTKDCGMMMVSKFQTKINTGERTSCSSHVVIDSRMLSPRGGQDWQSSSTCRFPRNTETGRHWSHWTAPRIRDQKNMGYHFPQNFSSFGAASPKLSSGHIHPYTIFYHGQIDDLRDDFIMEHHGTSWKSPLFQASST